MPSLDIVSKVDMQEVDNAVNSTVRELSNRYDFKGSKFTIDLKKQEDLILISAEDSYKLKAIQESLKVFATKRNIDTKSFIFEKEEDATGNSLRQEVKIKNGIDQESAKKIVKQIKNSKIKVQASIRGDELRVEGKKRDDLQEVINMVKKESSDLALQFINFRD